MKSFSQEWTSYGVNQHFQMQVDPFSSFFSCFLSFLRFLHFFTFVMEKDVKMLKNDNFDRQMACETLVCLSKKQGYSPAILCHTMRPTAVKFEFTWMILVLSLFSFSSLLWQQAWHEHWNPNSSPRIFCRSLVPQNPDLVSGDMYEIVISSPNLKKNKTKNFKLLPK